MKKRITFIALCFIAIAVTAQTAHIEVCYVAHHPNLTDGKTDLTKEEAYKKLKKEYETIVVNMPDIAKNKKRAKEYFVPYLTLYPKPYVDSLKDVEEYAKPKYEAKLRVLVDIAVDEVDSLEFKYNKDIFDLDNTKLSDKNKTPKGSIQ